MNEKKSGRYERLLKQIEPLINNNNGLMAHLSTVNAILYHKIEYIFWCGFYLLRNNELIVANYQGPLACQKLKTNTGVCWAGINSKKTIIVPDVEQFPGHIACDSRSKSEIVVPLIIKDQLIGVLDIDSTSLNTFDQTDAIYLEKIMELIASNFSGFEYI